MNTKQIETQKSTEEIIILFNKAFQMKDVTILNGIISTDCVMEGVFPPPDGSRIEGKKNCLDFWENLINTPGTQFTPESISVIGERAIILWRFQWETTEKRSVRGVNIMTVINGLITETLGYIKGDLQS
jgi:ketosteroid isomerase-like protein